MRARSIAAVLVVVLLVGSLASCSKKDSGSDEATSDKSDQADGSPNADDNSGSDDQSNGVPDDITDVMGECGEAYILYSSMVASSAQLMGGASDEQVEELEDQAAKLRDDLPEDLQDDMQTLSDAYADFAEAFSGGLGGGDAAGAFEALNSDEVAEAQANLNEYFKSCQ